MNKKIPDSVQKQSPESLCSISAVPLSRRRRGDVQLRTVFGHRAPGDVNAHRRQRRRQSLVRQGRAGIFRTDEKPQLLLDRVRGDQRSVVALEGGREKASQGDQAGLELDIFVLHRPADGGGASQLENPNVYYISENRLGIEVLVLDTSYISFL